MLYVIVVGNIRTFNRLITNFNHFEEICKTKSINLTWIFGVKYSEFNQFLSLENDIHFNYDLIQISSSINQSHNDEIFGSFISQINDINICIDFISSKYSVEYFKFLRLRFDLFFDPINLYEFIKLNYFDDNSLFINALNYPLFNAYTDACFLSKSKFFLENTSISKLEQIRENQLRWFSEFIPEVALYMSVKDGSIVIQNIKNIGLLRGNGDIWSIAGNDKIFKNNWIKYLFFSHRYILKKPCTFLYFRDFLSLDNLSFIVYVVNHTKSSSFYTLRKNRFSRMKAFIDVVSFDISLIEKFVTLIKLI